MYTQIFRSPIYTTPNSSTWYERIYDHNTQLLSSWEQADNHSIFNFMAAKQHDLQEILNIYLLGNPSPHNRTYIVHTSPYPLTLAEIQDLYPEEFI